MNRKMSPGSITIPGRINLQQVSKIVVPVLVLLVGILLSVMVSTGSLLTIIGILTASMIVLFLVREEVAVFILVAYSMFHPVMMAHVADVYLRGWKDILVVTFLFIWVARRLYTRTWVKSPLHIPIFAFLAILVVSLARAPNLPAGLMGMKYYLNYVPLYFIMVNISLTKKKLKSLITMLILLGAVNVGYGLGIMFGPPNIFRLPLEFMTFNPIGSIMVLHWFNGNTWAFLLLIGVCLLNASGSRKDKLVLYPALCVLFLGTVLSLLRIAWVTLISGLAMVTFLGKKKVLLYLLIGALIILFFAPPYITGRFISIFDATDRSRISKEVHAIPAGIQRILSNPAGYGLGSALSKHYTQIISNNVVMVVPDIESGVLNTGSAMGVLGILAYTWILFSAIWIGVRTYRSLNDGFLKWVAAGIVGFCLMVFVGDIYVSYLKTVEAFYWCFLGLLVSLERIERDSSVLKE